MGREIIRPYPLLPAGGFLYIKDYRLLGCLYIIRLALGRAEGRVAPVGKPPCNVLGVLLLGYWVSSWLSLKPSFLGTKHKKCDLKQLQINMSMIPYGGNQMVGYNDSIDTYNNTTFESMVRQYGYEAAMSLFNAGNKRQKHTKGYKNEKRAAFLTGFAAGGPVVGTGVAAGYVAANELAHQGGERSRAYFDSMSRRDQNALMRGVGAGSKKRGKSWNPMQYIYGSIGGPAKKNKYTIVDYARPKPPKRARLDDVHKVYGKRLKGLTGATYRKNKKQKQSRKRTNVPMGGSGKRQKVWDDDHPMMYTGRHIRVRNKRKRHKKKYRYRK